MLAFLAAIQFLTRIPVPIRIDYGASLLARSTVFFPLAGLGIGLLLILSAWLMLFLLPHYVVAVLLVVCWVALTGALHLDGLIDTADGMLSHRSRLEQLEIMKDSRIGAMGAVVAILYLLLKIVLVYACFRELPANWSWALLVVIPVFSRCVMVLAIVFWPYARAEHSLGRWFAEAGLPHAVLAFVLTVIIALLSTAIVFGSDSWFVPAVYVIVMLGFAIVFGMLVCGYVTRKLGGMTGDTFGALNELTEVALLLFAIMILG